MCQALTHLLSSVYGGVSNREVRVGSDWTAACVWQRATHRKDDVMLFANTTGEGHPALLHVYI